MPSFPRNRTGFCISVIEVKGLDGALVVLELRPASSSLLTHVVLLLPPDLAHARLAHKSLLDLWWVRQSILTETTSLATLFSPLRDGGALSGASQVTN